jgi:putative ABC transport system permease protein
MAWVGKMAWRDSRGRRLLLILFTASVLFGLGAVVSIHSLRDNLHRVVEEEARALLGADAILQTRFAPDGRLERYLRALPGEKVRERRFRTMAVFPEKEESRYVEVRAIDGPLPFYGEMETEPARGQAAALRSGTAIVEQGLMTQLGLKLEEKIHLGEKTFRIAAALVRMAGESEISGFFAPRIYVNATDLAGTGLLQRGSLVRYRTYVGVDPEEQGRLRDALAKGREDLFAEENVSVETVADRRRSVEGVLDNLLDFLMLSGFIALILGAVGMMGAVQVFVESKRDSIAMLRCLGATARQAFAIHLLQLQAFGILGAVAGSLLGVALPFFVPKVLGPFLPFAVEIELSWSALGTGLLFGWFIVTGSALLPLLRIRKISPLNVLRAEIDPGKGGRRDPLVVAVAGLFVLGLLAFVLLPAREPLTAAGFLGGIAVALGLLSLLAVGLRAGLRRLPTRAAPYAYRVALSNLYRPNNRTLLLLVTLGMGVFLLQSLLLTRQALLGQTDLGSSEEAANVVLLDVQPDQLTPLREWLAERGLRPRNELPIVTMRVESIKGRPLGEWRQMPDSPIDGWVYTWEFRTTYRDHVLDNAEVVAGTFTPRYEGEEPYPISFAENMLEDFGTALGDTITWNVQGLPVTTRIDSVRRVQWKAGRQNFGVVFPRGTIEAAPTTFAVTVSTEDRAETTALQAAVVEPFPNVSLIDLSLVFETLDDVLNRAAFVIRFMAGFTVATGLIVLAGAVMGSRYQRMRESVLFRTLGASRAFIRTVLLLEFLLIGMVAGLAGLALGYAGAAALLFFVFALPLQPLPLESLLILLVVMGLTMLTGWATSRGIARHPPLVVLRRE